jgi:hypothetical protein
LQTSCAPPKEVFGGRAELAGIIFEHFPQSCSAELEILWTAVFLAFGGVSAQLQGNDVTCAFAEALPKAKNPRSERPHYFLKRSRNPIPICPKQR